MEAKLYGQNKGGTSINGIIKDYYAYAGENISAGDLVEYVNGVAGKVDYGESSDTVIDSSNTYTGRWISALALDANRVFIAHSYTSGLKLYGIVCTVNGATITLGADTPLKDSNGTAEGSSIGLLPDGRVFISHKDNSNYLYGMLVSINGTTITVDVDTQLSTNKPYTFRSSTIALPNGNVFIAHSAKTDNYVYGMVCAIDGNTITYGTDTAINTAKSYTGDTISACLLTDGNVFVAHSYNSSHYLYARVCSISGTTITVGTAKALISDTVKTGEYISTCTLPDGKVFVAHSSSENLNLYGMVCTISGTTVSKGADAQLSSTTNSSVGVKAVVLLNGNVLITHSGNSNYVLYGMVCAIDNTTINKISDNQLNPNVYTGYTTEPVPLNNGTMCIAYSNGTDYKLNAQVWRVNENNIPTNNIIATNYETQVRKVTTGQFDGIAKTNGIGGDDIGHNDLVSIYTLVPIVTQEMAMADGNTLADANGDIFLVREEIA